MNDITNHNIDDALATLLEKVSKVEQEIDASNEHTNKTIEIVKERVSANIQSINENLSDIDTARLEAESDFDELILSQTELIADEE